MVRMATKRTGPGAAKECEIADDHGNDSGYPLGGLAVLDFGETRVCFLFDREESFKPVRHAFHPEGAINFADSIIDERAEYLLFEIEHLNSP